MLETHRLALIAVRCLALPAFRAVLLYVAVVVVTAAAYRLPIPMHETEGLRVFQVVAFLLPGSHLLQCE